MKDGSKGLHEKRKPERDENISHIYCNMHRLHRLLKRQKGPECGCEIKINISRYANERGEIMEQLLVVA